MHYSRIIRRGCGVCLIATLVVLIAVVPVRRVAAQGELEGEIPAGGGLAGVLWSGGPVDELATAASARGCLARSAWTFDGVALGYVMDAPSFVNEQFVARFPGAVLPANTILVLVCTPTTAGGTPADDGAPTLARVVAPYTPEASVLRDATAFPAAVGSTLGADDDVQTNASGLLNFLSPADELCTLLMNSRLVLRASGSHSLLAGARFCDSTGVGSSVSTAFGSVQPFGTTWLAELWPGVTGALSGPGLLVRVYSGSVAVTGTGGASVVVPAGAQVVVDESGAIGQLATFEAGPLERALLANRGTIAGDRRVQASGVGVELVDDATAVLSLDQRDRLHTVTLVNVGDRTLQISRIQSLDGNQFAVIGEDCSSRVLTPGGACTVTVEAVGCQEGGGWLADVLVHHDGAPSPYTITATKPGSFC